MKHAVALILAAVIAAPIAALAETLRADGGFISFGASDSSNNFSVYVMVGSDASGNRVVSLYYSLSQCSPFECVTVASGNGPVPPSMVKFSNGPGAAASINIPDIAALPNFNRSGQVQRGAINVTVTRNGSYTTYSQGTSTLRTPAFRIQRTGTSELGYGIATGSMLGVTLPPGAGSSGTYRNVTVTITKN